MLIKPPDDKTKDIAELQGLLAHPSATSEMRQRIEREIRNIRSGVKGEAEAAYELEFHFKNKNWMVIHDLRLEHGGRVAQIDHLLINRFLDIFVCESKRFSEGVAINDQGEFAAFYASRPYGIPSPLEQNKRHILVLESLFSDGVVQLPRRLGFTLQPHLEGYVLVSKTARITRPRIAIEGLNNIIKVDQVASRIDREMDNASPLVMARVIGQDTLEALARQIAGLHRPAAFNWAAKFGLDGTMVVPRPAAQPLATVPDDERAVPEEKAASKLVCQQCGVPVAYVVAKFCWNTRRFGGKVYCRECQKTV